MLLPTFTSALFAASVVTSVSAGIIDMRAVDYNHARQERRSRTLAARNGLQARQQFGGNFGGGNFGGGAPNFGQGQQAGNDAAKAAADANKKDNKDGDKNADATKDEAAKADAAKADAAKADAAKADAAKADAAKADATKNDATKNDAAKADAAKADAAKADATKNDATKNDAAKADAAKADATKADATKTDAAKADATKNDAANNDAAKADATKAAATAAKGGNNNNNNNNNGGTANAAAGGGTGDNCLKTDAIASGSAQTGQTGEIAAGQVESATDANNFINFCSKKTLTNGLQVQGGSCNGVVMGDIPSTNNMVSAIITSPKADVKVKPNTDFTISVQMTNLAAGAFTNAQSTYYSAPQALKGGIVVGHTHVTVQDLGNSLNPTKAPDAKNFAFFKGINDDGNGKGLLSAEVTGGLPAGIYRVCSMTSSSNHQPVLMPVAQRGAQDDCIRFTVG